MTAKATSIEKSLGNAGNALKKRIVKQNTHTRDKCKETKMVQGSLSGGSGKLPATRLLAHSNKCEDRKFVGAKGCVFPAALRRSALAKANCGYKAL